MGDMPVLTIVALSAMALAAFLGSIAWQRGRSWRWMPRGSEQLQQLLRLHTDGELPVLIRNLPFTGLPVSLAIASWGLAAALMALGLFGALALLLGALGIALVAVATWFAYSPPAWLIPPWLDETRRTMPPLRQHRWDRFMVVVLLVLTIPSALFLTAVGLYALVTVGWLA